LISSVAQYRRQALRMFSVRNISYFTCTLSAARKKPDPLVNNGANTASGLGCNNPVSVNARSRVVSLSDLTSHLGA